MAGIGLAEAPSVESVVAPPPTSEMPDPVDATEAFRIASVGEAHLASDTSLTGITELADMPTVVDTAHDTVISEVVTHSTPLSADLLDGTSRSSEAVIVDPVVEAAPVAPEDPSERDARITALNERFANGKITATERAEHSKLLAEQKNEKALPDAIAAVQAGTATSEQQATYDGWQLEQQTKERDDLEAKVLAGETLSAEDQARLDELKAELGDEAAEATFAEELEATLNGVDIENMTDPEAMGEFLAKMQGLAEKHNKVVSSEQLKADFNASVKEWFKKRMSSEGLTYAEKAELAEVKGLISEMRNNIFDIMNAKKLVDSLYEQQREMIREIKGMEKEVPSIINEGDEEAQKKAMALTQKYNELAVMNANIIVTGRRAELGQENFRLNRAKVRRTLGVSGFWSGMVDVAGARIRNKVREAKRQVGSLGNFRPLAV